MQWMDHWQKNDTTGRARGLGRKTREEIGMGNQMTALRLQTGVPQDTPGLPSGSTQKYCISRSLIFFHALQMFSNAQKMWTTSRTMNIYVVRYSPKGSNLHILQLNVSTVVRNTGTASQLWVCFSFFLSGWLGRCSGAWRVTHEGFYQGEWWSAVEHDESTWGFLLGWMRYSGAWRVNLEGFCKGEWQGAVKHDEPTMRFLSGWMGRCSGAWWSKEVNMVLNVHRNHEAY